MSSLLAAVVVTSGAAQAQPGPADAAPAMVDTDGDGIDDRAPAQPAEPPAATPPTAEPPTATPPTAEPPAEQTPPDGATVSLEPERKKLPPKEEEVLGTCKTPRQAWLQLLYWLNERGKRWDPFKAAACFDIRGLGDDPQKAKERAGELAETLKTAIDAEGAYIDVDDIPTDPNYTNPKTGLPRYIDPIVDEKIDGVNVVKIDGRWLFSQDTLERIPDMAGLSQSFRSAMPDWMRKSFLGVELWSYVGILLLIFVALLFQKITVFVIGTYARRLVGQTQFKYLDTAIRKADRPIGGLAMALVFYIGFPMLLFPVRVSQLAMIATEALAAYSVVWLGYRLIDVLTDYLAAKAENTDTKLDDQLVPLLSKTLKVFVSVIGGIFILQNMNVDVGSLLAGLGLGGLAFALAAKDTVANFFGSIMIFIDKPFQIGDWIVMQDVEGTIEEVGFRTSRVRTFYNSVVTVPNSMVVNSTVDNLGRRQYRRYVTTLGLTYDTPPEKVQAFCEGVRAVIAGMPGMRKDYYLVEFKDFGASALEVMLYCFMAVPSFNEEMRTRSRLNLEIVRVAKEVGVSFAFPTQTLHVETLVNQGESRPQWSGSTEPEELAPVIDAFGPGGGKARPKGIKISDGYYCDLKRVGADDGGE